MPRVVARPISEGRLQRTIFTAARTRGADAPAVVAVREALSKAALTAAADRRDVQVVPAE
jgi:hypothetical protein